MATDKRVDLYSAESVGAFFGRLKVLHGAVAPRTGEIVSGPPPPSEQLEAAARDAVAYARQANSRLVWACLLATFEEFVKHDVQLPRGLLLGLAEIFERYREGGTFDAAFGIKRRRGGVQDLVHRNGWERTNADLFGYFHEQLGLSVEEATARVAAFGPGGRRGDAYRHYRKHSKK